MRLEEACESFLSRCVALNLADGSVAWYRHILRDMGVSLTGRGVRGLEEVTPSLLRDHLTNLKFVQSHRSEPSAIPPTRTHLV